VRHFGASLRNISVSIRCLHEDTDPHYLLATRMMVTTAVIS